MKDVDATSNPSEAKPESFDESRPEAPVEKPVSEHPGKRKKQQEFAHAKRRELETRARQPRELKEGEVREPRRPKRKVAVLIGYCGTGYHGMQINPPHATIEGDLFDAFVKAGAISKDNSDDPKKSSFMRAARTDKGVHAAGNVVSLKLIIEDPDVVEKINSHLPDQIRVWGISRTNKSFECRKMCSSRVYEYLIPSYSFLPPKPSSAFAQRIAAANAEHPDKQSTPDPEGEEFWREIEKKLAAEGVSQEDIRKLSDMEEQEQETRYSRANSPEEAEEKQAKLTSQREELTAKEWAAIMKKIKSIENEARRAYRISPERLERIRQAFKLYEGVHNFHNFTIGKDFKDPSATRYMKSLTVSDPKIIDGTEWLSIKIHGQSFMLHQIRKMVAMAALVVRNGCAPERITEAFGSTKISIPKAPSLGLLLEQPVYDAYNKKLEDFGHGAVSFEEHMEKLEAFKMKHIYDKIYSEEAKENVFHGFFAFIDAFRGDAQFDYLTSRGIEGATHTIKLSKEDQEELKGDNEG